MLNQVLFISKKATSFIKRVGFARLIVHGDVNYRFSFSNYPPPGLRRT